MGLVLFQRKFLETKDASGSQRYTLRPRKVLPLPTAPSIANLPTISIPKRIPILRAEPRTRLKELPKIVRRIALPIRKCEAAGRPRILRVASTATRLLTLLAAGLRVGDGDLAGDGPGATAGVVDLEDPLVAVRVVDDVI